MCKAEAKAARNSAVIWCIGRRSMIIYRAEGWREEGRMRATARRGKLRTGK